MKWRGRVPLLVWRLIGARTQTEFVLFFSPVCEGGFKGGGAPLNSGAAQSGVRPKDVYRECFVAKRKNTKGRARGGSGANDAPKGGKRAANVSAGGRVGLPIGCPYGRGSAGEGQRGAIQKRERSAFFVLRRRPQR